MVTIIIHEKQLHGMYIVNVVDTFYTPLLYVYMFAFYNHQEEDVPRRSTKKK